MHRLTPAEQLTLASYDRQAAQWSNAHMTAGMWSAEMADFHEALPSGRLLEIGSGGGRDAKELIPLGYDYVGTDVSHGLLEQARKNNPTALFNEMSVYDLPYENEFDGFWCAAVLLHIPRDRLPNALSVIARAMKPGAVGFITLKEGAQAKFEDDDTGKRYFVYWQNDAFKAVLAKHGFHVIQEGYRPVSERTKWLTYIVRVEK